MLTLTLLITTLAATAQPALNAEMVFPPNPQHNHGSSIVETQQGDLLACWFHGSGERQSDDVLIQGARKRKGDTQWSAPFLMADTQDLPDCNPVLFIDPRGTLWLFWITVQDNEWGGSLLKYRTATRYSADGPPKWDWQDVIHCRPVNFEQPLLDHLAEIEKAFADEIAANEGTKEEFEHLKSVVNHKLTTRIGWMTRLHPIMLPDNRMMLGLYSDVFNCCLAAFTSDWGNTWQFSEPILGIGNVQPSFVRKKDGTIVSMMRDNGPLGFIQQAQSQDNGITWTKSSFMSIPNPGSSVECIALTNGHWVLVCNDTTEGRHVLSAYLSEDEGQTWTSHRPIENMEKDKGSASYPSVIQTADGAVHCTYSFTSADFTGSTIKHATFTEDWIRTAE